MLNSCPLPGELVLRSPIFLLTAPAILTWVSCSGWWGANGLSDLAHVNSEIGTIQPLRNRAIIKERNPATLFHVDGVQSFGKLPVDLAQWQADLFSFSSHKIHGPKGVGALWVKGKPCCSRSLHGGDQEAPCAPARNMPGIIRFGYESVMAAENMAASAAAVRELEAASLPGACQSRSGG